MPDSLYRFRSVNALLGEYQELEAQQIYFCPPDELNDPLEGFKDIFWFGDRIVWQNLFRHYLLNLMKVSTITMLRGDEFTIAECENLIFQDDSDLPQAPIRDIYSNICNEFFRHPTPERLIAALSSQRRKIRRDELIFYLRLMHPLAISKINTEFGKHGLGIMQSQEPLDHLSEEINNKINEILHVHSQNTEQFDILFSANENILSQLTLINEFNNPIEKSKQPLVLIARDFPVFYVNSVEHLLHPDWHVACFVENPINASMWSTYADGHRGACLKFKVGTDNSLKPSLDLYRVVGWTGSGSGITENRNYAPLYFEKIRYTTEFPEIDFFESIGTLPKGKLLRSWFSDQNGIRSTTASRMLMEDQTWRDEYWQKFIASYSTKSPEWAHEEEYRLTLHSSLTRFDSPESRKLKYKFSDLEGIIFGIKTTIEDKLRIMRIIEKKCLTEGRQDFQFYQAHYSSQLRKIECVPLTLLKFQSP